MVNRQAYSDIFTGWAYPPRDYHKWAELVFLGSPRSRSMAAPKLRCWYWELWKSRTFPLRGTPENTRKLMTSPPCREAGFADGQNVWRTSCHRPTEPAPSSGYATSWNTACEGLTNATGKIGSPLDLHRLPRQGAPKVIEGRVG